MNEGIGKSPASIDERGEHDHEEIDEESDHELPEADTEEFIMEALKVLDGQEEEDEEENESETAR